MKQHKSIYLISGGLLLILLLTIAVFVGLDSFMDDETEKDVHRIAQTYLEGISQEELNQFKTIAELQYLQVEHLKVRLESLGEDAAPEVIIETARDAAEFQNVRSCAFLDEDGRIVTVYGKTIFAIDDMDYVRESLMNGNQTMVRGYDENQNIIMWVMPISCRLPGDTRSIGLLFGYEVDRFINKMRLNTEGTLCYFSIIRRDGSYLFVERGDAFATSFVAHILLHTTPEGMTAPEAVMQLTSKMAQGEDFSMTLHFDYDNEEEDVHIHENRNVHCTPIPQSEWYLVTILPYGVLDKAIENIGANLTSGMLKAVGILALGLLIVFGVYLKMIQRHVDEVERAGEEALKAKEAALKAKEEAEAARNEAEHANQAKSHFLSNMSHDMRTPMNAIIGMTAIAQEHTDDPIRVAEYIRKISLSGKQLLGLINDVLDMAKIESGKMNLNLEALSLRESMKTICDIVRPQIKINGQNFDIFISNIISEEVFCDSIRLNQILLNLLSNAMKFTPTGGAIHIDIWQEESPKGDNYVRTDISVRDTGIGMSEEFRKKLFTAFEREDSKRVQKAQGTGLGLAITKHIVDAMGGSIDVHSVQGAGTTFKVSIDLEKVTESEDEMQLPAWKILVVDDNEELCRTAQKSLRELGTDPHFCTNGKDAIQMVVDAHKNGEGYFAVLIDYKLGEMNGIEIADAIWKALGDKIPISLISAYDWSDIEEEALSAGITGFIAKPLFKSTLYHELRQYIKEEELPVEEASEEDDYDLTGLKVLVAEDIEVNAEIIMMILEEFGAEADHGADGKITAEMFERSPVGYYGVILMDLRMPNMDGFEATATIRRMDRADAKTIPIIAVTADAFAEDVQHCFDVGMNAHIAKPVDGELLIKTIIANRS